MLVKVNILRFSPELGLNDGLWEVMSCHKFLKKIAKKIKLAARQ